MDPDDISNDLPQLGQTKPSSDDNSISDDEISSKSQKSPVSINGNNKTQSITKISVPDEASDTDLIEKEWVERAKQIVEHTRDSPHEQQRAISQMKADYMKKRYNKDIKLSDE